MAVQDLTVIDETRVSTVSATVRDGQLRLAPAALHSALGWELKPQGLCKDDRCIPLTAEPDLVDADGVDLGALAAVLSRPLAVDLAERMAYLGGAARERAAQLRSLEAPDFRLPDLDGRGHALSDWRGTKVLLLAYASW